MMGLTEKLIMGQVLINILEEQTKLMDDPYDDKLPEIIKRAIYTQLRMKKFFRNQGEPPEMVEQIEQMDSIIKRLLELQNKKCY